MSMLSLYKRAFDEFISDIDNDYIKKKTISKVINKIYNKMLYSAPEILCDIFYRESFRLQELLPEPTNWSIKAWNKLLLTHKEIIETIIRNNSNNNKSK